MEDKNEIPEINDKIVSELITCTRKEIKVPDDWVLPEPVTIKAREASQEEIDKLK